MSRHNYDKIKARWQAGESFTQIEKDPGMPTHQAMSKRAIKEGWERGTDLTEAVAKLRIVTNPLTKATPQVIHQFIELISQGVSKYAAARRLGLNPKTIMEWLEKDGAFGCMVESAEAIPMIEYENCIHKHAIKNPTWSAYKLERTDNPAYKRDQQDTKLEVVFNVTRDIKTVSDQ